VKVHKSEFIHDKSAPHTLGVNKGFLKQSDGCIGKDACRLHRDREDTEFNIKRPS